MSNWALFETTESVIEILWDIALAFFVVRLAFIYFLLVFVSGALLGYIGCSHLELAATASPQHSIASQGELVMAAAMVGIVAAWARYVIVRYEIPPATGFRLAMGATALLFMLVAQALVGLVLYEGGYAGWARAADWRMGMGFAGLLAAFGLMPVVMIGLEKSDQEGGGYRGDMEHGDEKKSLAVNSL